MHYHHAVKTFLIHVPYGTPDTIGCFPSLTLVHLGTLLKNARIPFQVVDLQLMFLQDKIDFSDANIHHVIAKNICKRIQGTPVFLFVTMDKGLPFAVNLAKACKRMKKESHIVFGGVQATLMAHELMTQYSFIDYVVKGEAETTLIQLIQHLEKKESTDEIKGIVYRKGNQIYQTAPQPFLSDLDRLPMADFSIIPPLKGYQSDREKSGYMVHIDVGRGCQYACSFCSSSLFWENQVRQKSPERIFSDMITLNEKYQISDFIFNHDQFLDDRNHVTSLCDLLSQTDKPITWRCYGRVDHLDEDFIHSLAMGKCNGIFFGIESASPSIQKLSHKQIDVVHTKKMIEQILLHKMTCMASFIICFPEETIPELNQTLRLALTFKSVGSQIEISLLEPYVGTRLWHRYGNHPTLCRDFLHTHYAFLTQADIERIMENKQIFSYFYKYPTSHLKLKTYYLLKIFFSFAINILPGTLVLLLDKLDLSPMELFDVWMQRMTDKEEKNFFLADKVEQQINCFLTFASDIAKQHDKKLSMILADQMKRDIQPFGWEVNFYE